MQLPRLAVGVVVLGLVAYVLGAGGPVAASARQPRPLDVKISDLLTIVVQVLGADATGKVGPIRNASVSIYPGDQGVPTNAAGEAAMTAGGSVTAGDYVTIVAEADGYRVARLRYLADDKSFTLAYPSSSSLRSRFLAWLIGHREPITTIVLERGVDPPEGQIELTIRVRDEDGDPVEKAAVKLCCSNDAPIGDSWTNEAGEVGYFVKRSALAAGLQAQVSTSDGRAKFSDISSSVLAGTGHRVFLVVLPNKKSPEPTTLTLTVNGKSDTATTAKPTNDDPDPLVVHYGKSLNIKVTANEPMPRGWSVAVRHNGDVLSHGNGDYALVCQVKAGASSCSVTRPPPTAALTADFDDLVYAQLLAPTYVARNVQILVNYRK